MRVNIIPAFFILGFLSIVPEIVSAQSRTVYNEGWIDFNKNGIKDIYEDPTQNIRKEMSNEINGTRTREALEKAKLDKEMTRWLKIYLEK